MENNIIQLPIPQQQSIQQNIQQTEYDPNDVFCEYKEKYDDKTLLDEPISNDLMHFRIAERNKSLISRCNNNVNACQFTSNKSNHTLIKVCEWDMMSSDGSYNDYTYQLPERTSIACFQCEHQFSTQPIPCPIRYYEKMNWNNDVLQNVWLVTANFCSWRCQKKFIMTGDRELCGCLPIPLLSLSKMFYDMYYKRDDTPAYEDIVPAPSRFALEKYGGPMSLAEYRGVEDHFELIIDPIITVLPKLKQKYDVLIETSTNETNEKQQEKQEKHKSNTDAVFPTKKGSYDEQYNLKRSKKPTSAKNTLRDIFKKK